jgi:SAM-dependent methyltransferase
VTLAGVNVDEGQLVRARRLLAEHGKGGIEPMPFITADGCKLPVRDTCLDHMLAVECLFHFPSRKLFFREVSRVLKPGGTLGITDFVAAPRALHSIVTRTAQSGLGENSWYGRQSKPPTVAAYERMARSVGMDMVVNDDVTERTMPTYPSLRNLYIGAGYPEGAASVDGLEDLASSGDLGYHVIGFQKRK